MNNVMTKAQAFAKAGLEYSGDDPHGNLAKLAAIGSPSRISSTAAAASGRTATPAPAGRRVDRVDGSVKVSAAQALHDAALASLRDARK